MNGYLTGSSGSVAFTVYTGGEIEWAYRPSAYKYITWSPTHISGYCYYASGLSVYSTKLATYPGYGNITATSFWFQSCTWTDIEANFTNTTKYNNGMFQNCSTLLTARLPLCNSVGSYTFYCCSNLSSVSLPECLLIDSYAFAGCSSLASINLPVCTYISSAAFEACVRLSAITLGASTVVGLYYYNPQYPSRASNIFALTGLTSSTGSIYVPSSLVYRYQTDACWSYFSARIFSIPE